MAQDIDLHFLEEFVMIPAAWPFLRRCVCLVGEKRLFRAFKRPDGAWKARLKMQIIENSYTREIK